MQRRSHADVLIFIPAWDEVETVGDVVRAVRAELAASEDHSRYSPTLVRRFGTALFRRALNFVTRHHFTDTTSGLRAANRRAIELFASEYAGDYPELESLHSLVRNGLRFEEVP